MKPQTRPYIASCSFCQAGKLRFQRCETCDEVVVHCDGCELMWGDVRALSDDTNLSSDSRFPQCPACGCRASRFTCLTMQDLEDAMLHQCIEGESI